MSQIHRKMKKGGEHQIAVGASSCCWKMTDAGRVGGSVPCRRLVRNSCRGKDLGRDAAIQFSESREKSDRPCRDSGRISVPGSGVNARRANGSKDRMLPGSRHVLPTQETIDHLANRIERAYTLRRAGWDRGCSTPRVWAAAAMCLWQAHVDDPELPLDSELFVASQPIGGALGDPWMELTQTEAARRYRSQVRRIVHRLRVELKREVRRAERMIREGTRFTLTALSQDRRLSPLGCYIAAYRVGRIDIAGLLAGSATEQHRACPLYRLACLPMLPADRYPVNDPTFSPESSSCTRTLKKTIVMN